MPSNTKDDSWLIGNLKHSGFYRVNYDKQNWDLLIKQLNEEHTIIDPLQRSQLLDDSFNLGKAELIDQMIFLDITKYLRKELNDLPFFVAFNGLDYIAEMLSDDYHAFEMFKVTE